MISTRFFASAALFAALFPVGVAREPYRADSPTIGRR